MILPIEKAADGKLHAVVNNRRPGRPLSLNRPLDEIRRAIGRRVDRLERHRAKVERELRRWKEMAASFAH